MGAAVIESKENLKSRVVFCSIIPKHRRVFLYLKWNGRWGSDSVCLHTGVNEPAAGTFFYNLKLAEVGLLNSTAT